MATNKRKDSAALFELIDKSTLKVPKQTGSLKIPSWWSSKTNPPSPARHNGAGISPAPTPPATPPSANEEIPDVAAAPDSPAVPQQRLFQPGAPGAGALSPSIRPPAPVTDHSGPATAANGNGNGGHAHAGARSFSAAADTLETAADSPELAEPAAHQDAVVEIEPGHEGYAGSGNGRRPFVPQTMSQTYMGGADWTAGRRFHLARTPLWILVAAGSGAVIILALVIYLLMGIRWHSAKTNANAVNTGTPLVDPGRSNPSGPTLLPSPGQRQSSGFSPSPNGHPANNSLLVPRDEHHATPEPVKPAQVFRPGAISREPALYYIEIATSSESIAKRNADFIAAHGVDVSMETQAGRSGRLLYKLISVKGFRSISEAQPLRRRIVEIGHQLPEFSRTRRAWDDATVIRWSAIAPPRG